MTFELPRKRIFLGFHRWMGVLSAVFLLVLALTGLALNHAERLGLHQVMIRNPLLLARYGMAGRPDIASFRIGSVDTISRLGGRLYLNGSPLAEGGPPVGWAAADGLLVIATPRELLLLTPAGELVERLEGAQLPYAELRDLGEDPAGRPVLVADNGRWQPDPEWLVFSPYAGPFAVGVMQAVDVEEPVAAALLARHQGEGVALYRVLLDLHSGRLFGWGGRTLMDLTAVAILLLVSSGIAGWLRRSQWGPH